MIMKPFKSSYHLLHPHTVTGSATLSCAKKAAATQNENCRRRQAKTEHKSRDGEKLTLASVEAFSFQYQDKICCSSSCCYILGTAGCVGLDDGTTHNHPSRVPL